MTQVTKVQPVRPAVLELSLPRLDPVCASVPSLSRVDWLAIQLAIFETHGHLLTKYSLVKVAQQSQGEHHLWLVNSAKFPAIPCGTVKEVLSDRRFTTAAAALLYTVDLQRQETEDVRVIDGWAQSAGQAIEHTRMEVGALKTRLAEQQYTLSFTQKKLSRQRWLNGALVIAVLLVVAYVVNGSFVNLKHEQQQSLYARIMAEPLGKSYEAPLKLEGMTVPDGKVALFIGWDARLLVSHQNKTAIDVTTVKYVVAVVDEGGYFERATLRSPGRYRLLDKGEYMQIRDLLVQDYESTHLFYQSQTGLLPAGTILG